MLLTNGHAAGNLGFLDLQAMLVNAGALLFAFACALFGLAWQLDVFLALVISAHLDVHAARG